MKAKAPEKIYLSKDLFRWSFSKASDRSDIEYTRTDAFIKKACCWLECNLSDRPMGDIYFWVNDFKEYMEGE